LQVDVGRATVKMPFEEARTTKMPFGTKRATAFNENILFSNVGGKIA